MPPVPRRLRALMLIPALGALGSVAACASGGTSGGGSAGRAAASGDGRSTSRSSTLITAADIERARPNTALEAIERIRPTFLRSANARFPVQVYVNGALRGGTTSLRGIRADDVLAIRRLTASEAQTRYGPDLLSGVIEIEMKPGRG